MKRSILFSIICCLGFYNAYSYSDSTITPADFKTLIGYWEGSLTYLDYTSNKPFSMPANILVKDFKNSNLIICSLIYPKEPNANSLDTMFISEDGRLLNNDFVKIKSRYNNDSIKVVTEITGTDGNDNKGAIIRHTYILGKHSYSIKKEVQFVGQNQWILRNEYNLLRVRPGIAR